MYKRWICLMKQRSVFESEGIERNVTKSEREVLKNFFNSWVVLEFLPGFLEVSLCHFQWTHVSILLYVRSHSRIRWKRSMLREKTTLKLKMNPKNCWEHTTLILNWPTSKAPPTGNLQKCGGQIWKWKLHSIFRTCFADSLYLLSINKGTDLVFIVTE